MSETLTRRPEASAYGNQERDASVRRGLMVALAWAQTRLATLRREDYRDERAFKSVLTQRRKAVRRVERMLQEVGGIATAR